VSAATPGATLRGKVAAVGLHRTGGLFEVRSSHAVGDLAVLEAAFAAMEQGITIHDRDGRIVVCNPAAARMSGVPSDEILGTHPPYRDYDMRDEHGEPLTAETSPVIRALETGRTELGRLLERRTRKPGPSKWFRVNYQPLFGDGDPRPWGVVASFVEVEPPGAATCDSKVAPVALHHAPEPIVALDGDGFALHANAAARAVASEIPELAAAIEGREALRPVLFERARFELPTRDDLEDDKPIELTCCFERQGAAPAWIAARFRPGRPEDTPVASVCSMRVVTREREREEELAYSALHDPLTGLANRRLMDAHLDVALARARRGEHSVGLLFLDLDGFKQINDEHGHNVGDAVLVEVAKRLGRAVRASDPIGRAADPASLVSRPGGDEFLVVLSDLTPDPAQSIAAVIDRVRRAMQEPFQVGDTPASVTVSIGAAEYPLDGRDVHTLVERANGMMRAAKRGRR
jgi:diguanylate cyclase (GGDEF)-like protein/PAS domain S-box-containing protein